MRSPLAPTAALAMLVLVSAPGCARERADAADPAPAGDARIDSSATRPVLGAIPRGVVRGFVLAAPETIRLSPEQPPPRPTAEYASLETVRDSVLAMILRAVAHGDTAVHVSSAPTRFKYHNLPDSTSGYAIHVVVTDTSSCPAFELDQALASAGWVEQSGYSADGPDGTLMGRATRQYLCVIEGSWDGGDDSDTTYVPAPGCEVTVTCVPRREDDVFKY